MANRKSQDGRTAGRKIVRAKSRNSKTTKGDLSTKLKNKASKVNSRRRAFLARRPHRSFRLTRRRDYTRSLKLPGYWSLTKQVFSLLLSNKRIFFGLALIYASLAILMSSLMSQETYLQLRDLVDTANENGELEGFLPTLAIFWGVLTSQVTNIAPNSPQQIMGILFGLFSWLSAVWLARAIMAGQKPRIRDGLYSSGGPVVALLVLVLVVLVQIAPAAAALIAYNAANATGLLDQTAILMLFGGGAILLVTLSLYWLVSTVFAMVIVMLPDMYPGKAIKLAGDIVVGRRIRILLRMLWLVVLILILWAAVIIPAILIDGGLKSAIPALEWLPFVPAISLLVASFSIVFAAVYTYVFYRKVIEDDAAPA